MHVLTKDPSVHWSSPQQRSYSDKPLPTIQPLGFEPTRWGWYPWCPEPLDQIVHSFDVGLANRFIPGPRILTVNRFLEDPQYLWVSYGHLSFRLKPILWRQVDFPGYNLGDLVEVSKLYSPHEPSMATIEEITWDQSDECIKFQLSRRGRMISGLFTASQFSLASRISDPEP